MHFKIILVEPKYQINLGSIARVSSNFGIKKLYVVKPRAKIAGKQAIMFSKHASSLLKNAKIYDNIDDAVKDCDILIGTTGLWRKSKANFYNVNLADLLVEKLKKSAKKDTVVGLLIGRDDIGLTKSEIEICDFIAYIGTSEDYPVMSISHATAILLYLFTRSGYNPLYSNQFKNDPPKKEELNALFDIFDSNLKGKDLRNPEAIKRIFRKIIRTSMPSDEEVKALMSGLK
jgi:tRNA/rRNA methyltransferase